MTLPNREAVWRWLGTAPAPVVLSICLTTTGALGGWVWLVAGEVSEQRATAAVAAEQAKGAKEAATAVEARLTRLEDKLDRLLEAVADLRAGQAASTQPLRPRRVDKDTTEKNQ